jgi:hypothetical protein
MALAPNFTTSAFPIPNYFTFKIFLLEVVAIGRKNAGKDPDNTYISSLSGCQRGNTNHCLLANCGGVGFRSLDRRKIKLRNGKKDLIQVHSEFSPPTSKLVA